jgi:hypothetical protein
MSRGRDPRQHYLQFAELFSANGAPTRVPVARMASPTGITMNADPGKTSSAMPISSTVAPTTETITRLTILMFSKFQMLDRRFIQRGRVVGRFITRTRCHHIVRHK